jgi:hypothetical protein
MAIVLTRQMPGGSLFAFKIVSEPAAVHIVLVMVNAVVVHIRDAVGGKEVRAGITDFLRTQLLVTMSGDGFLHFESRKGSGEKPCRANQESLEIGRHRPTYADLPPLLTRSFFASLWHLRWQTLRCIACPFPLCPPKFKILPRMKHGLNTDNANTITTSH